MKILKDEVYEALTRQAGAFVSVQNALVETSEDVKAEDVTATMIIDALQGSENSESLEAVIKELSESQANAGKLQTDLDAVNSELTTAQARIVTLEQEVKELQDLPGANPARVNAEGEVDGEKETLAEFANKNAGDTQAILLRAKEEGLI